MLDDPQRTEPPFTDRRTRISLLKATVLSSPLYVLGVLAIAHFLLDLVATTVNPLWPVLEESHQSGEGGLLWIYVVWTLSTSVFQFVFGYIGDRMSSGWMLWAGPLVAVVGLSSIGLASSPAMLAGIVMISGWGVAAFHPEGAATAGGLMPEHRSRVMAIFALSGYLGQSVGPYYAGRVVDLFSLTGLLWTLAWALPVMGLIALNLRRPNDAHAPPRPQSTIPAVGSHGPKTLLLLLAVGVLRIVPALGVPLSFAYLLRPLGASNADIGLVQSLFMAGLGSGGIVCALCIGKEHERTILWVMPLCATPALLCLTLPGQWVMHAGVTASGLLLGVAMPVFISYGQRLLPHGQRVASSITMGVSWGVSSGVVALMVHLLQQRNELQSIFYFFAGSAALSSLASLTLPHASVSESKR